MGVVLPKAIIVSSRPIAGKALAVGLNGKIDPSVLPTSISSRETLFDTKLTGSTAAVIATGIPGTFAQLMLVCYLRTDRSAVLDGVVGMFNGDNTGANYSSLNMDANGAGFATGDTATASTAGFYGGFASAAATAVAASFGSFTLLIPNYANTAGAKVATFWGGVVDATTSDSNIVLGNVRWNNSAAINSITLSPYVGTNFVAGSRVTLYGMA